MDTNGDSNYVVNRRLLDFDFEKVCSVALSTLNCYACLACGKYFQGRSEGSPAYMHALHNDDHRLFLNLKSLRVFVLPDNTEFNDQGELNDVRRVISPSFSCELLRDLDSITEQATDLHGKSYWPGFIGLNNLKANDYVNVVIQALAHIPPLRNHFLTLSHHEVSGKSELCRAFKDVLEKIWNPTRFKAQMSPHEFLQTVSSVSQKRFSLVKQSDPIDFLVWLLHSLSLTAEEDVVLKLLQGRVRVDSFDFPPGTRKEDLSSIAAEMRTDVKPFFFLTLNLPAKPLFQDPRNLTAIPQVSLSSLLEKFNGGNLTFRQTQAFAYSIPHYPPYLILHIDRFVKNRALALEEHNPTIVNFSPQALKFPANPHEMQDDGNEDGSTYSLLANIYCTSALESVEGKSRSYGIHLRHAATGTWLKIENLSVEVAEAPMLFMAESCIQIWERAS